MKYTFLNQFFFLCLFNYTISTEAKISISKKITSLPQKISSFFSKNEETTFQEFTNIKQLEILCEIGNVTLRSWKQNCVLIEIKKQGSESFQQNLYINAEKKNDLLQVTTKILDHKNTGTIELNILAPEDITIKTKTTTGTITIKNLSGHIQAYTDNGTINLFANENYYARFSFETEQGYISSDIFITLEPQTTKINKEFFLKQKHSLSGFIGNLCDDKIPGTFFLHSKKGNIFIKAYEHFT